MAIAETERKKHRFLRIFRRSKATPPKNLPLPSFPEHPIELRSVGHYLRENLQTRKVPTIQDIAKDAHIAPRELPQAMQKMATEIADIIPKSGTTVETGYETRIDFIYRCWAATRHLPRWNSLYSFARSLDSFDSFVETYLPNASRKVRGGLVDRVSDFVETVIHPQRSLDLYKKGTSWHKESTFGIYTFDGKWIYIPGQESLLYRRYAERQVIEEAKDLCAKETLKTDDMYHASGSSILNSVARHKAILSVKRAHEKGETVKTGEFVTYIQRDTDKPIGGYTDTVFAGDSRELGYGKAIWFDEFPVVFGISRDTMRSFLTKRRKPVDFSYHVEEGILLGPEVPLKTITTISANSRYRERVEEWMERNGLQKRVQFISLEAIRLAEEYRAKPTSFWDNLLESAPIKIP